MDAPRRGGSAFDFDDHPWLVIWELTQACDLACVHCRACATTARDPGELSTAEGKKLLERVAAMGTPLVVLTGGDPAKRSDLVELVRHGASLGLSMAVTPSGTALMTKALLAELQGAGLARIAVSVDGPDAATHDAFRKVEGSFAHSERILSDARALGLPAQINTTLWRGNMNRLGEMASLAGRLDVKLLSVFVVVPTGRASDAMTLDADEIEDALLELEAIRRDCSFDIKTTAAPQFRRVLLQEHSRRDSIGIHTDVDPLGIVRGPRGINDGVGFLFVSHRGDIFPSGFLPLKAGNVRIDRLEDVYRWSPVFTNLRDTSKLEGKCGVCPFRQVCGGSRARAYAATGNPNASDPGCPYVPRAMRHLDMVS